MRIRNQLFAVILPLILLPAVVAGYYGLTGMHDASQKAGTMASELSQLENELGQSLKGIRNIFNENQRGNLSTAANHMRLETLTAIHNLAYLTSILGVAGDSLDTVITGADLYHFGTPGTSGEQIIVLDKDITPERFDSLPTTFTPLPLKLDSPFTIDGTILLSNDAYPTAHMYLRAFSNDSQKPAIGVISTMRWLTANMNNKADARISTVLADHQGRILVHPNYELVGLPLPEHFPAPSDYHVIQHSVLDGFLTLYALASTEDTKAAANILITLTDTIKKRTEHAEHQASMVLSQLSDLSTQFLLVSFIALLLGTLATGFLAHRLTRPIRMLAKAATAIASGDLDSHIKLSKVHGVELQQLGAELNNMRSALKGQLENLDHLVAERTAALNTARAEAEELSRAKGDFVALMSHEIRTPLNSILGFSDILWETDLDEEQRNFVRIFRSSGELLLNILNDVLDFSRLEAGHVVLEHIPYNLRAEVENITAIIAGQANSNGLDLNCHFDPNIPPMVMGDPTRLRQILMNLLSNAVKFTERGEVSLTVTPAPESGPDFLAIKVLDTGIGMKRDALDSLFDPFCQADISTTRKYGGSGLGLTIASNLTELMGGFISVKSAPGRGSQFTVLIPLEPASDDVTQEALAKTKNKQGFDDLPSMHILLVQADVANLDLIRYYLDPSALQLQVVTEFDTALGLLKKQSFDLVLLDLEAPGISDPEGENALKAIKKALPNGRPPTAALYPGPCDEEQRARSSFDACLEKPIQKQPLLDLLRRFAG